MLEVVGVKKIELENVNNETNWLLNLYKESKLKPLEFHFRF